MKKTSLLLLGLLVVVFLVGCEISVRFDLNQFVLESAQYRTNYLYRGASVVCDDRATSVEIDLRYRGEIDYVRVGLVGEDSGRRHSLSSFSPSTNENDNGVIKRTFRIMRGVSPLASTDQDERTTGFSNSNELVSPQSIVVVPINPEVIGYTAIDVQIETEEGITVLYSRSIPVFNFCD